MRICVRKGEFAWFLVVHNSGPGQSSVEVLFPLDDIRPQACVAVSFSVLRTGVVVDSLLSAATIDPADFMDSRSVKFSYGGDNDAASLVLNLANYRNNRERAKVWAATHPDNLAFTDFLSVWQVCEDKEEFTRERTLDLLITLAAELVWEVAGAAGVPLIGISSELDLPFPGEANRTATELPMSIEGLAYKTDDFASVTGLRQVAALLPGCELPIRTTVLRQLNAHLSRDQLPFTPKDLRDLTKETNVRNFERHQKTASVRLNWRRFVTTQLLGMDLSTAPPIPGQPLVRFIPRSAMVDLILEANFLEWEGEGKVRRPAVQQTVELLVGKASTGLGKRLSQLMANSRQFATVFVRHLEDSEMISDVGINAEAVPDGFKYAIRCVSAALPFVASAYQDVPSEAEHVALCRLVADLLGTPGIIPAYSRRPKGPVFTTVTKPPPPPPIKATPPKPSQPKQQDRPMPSSAEVENALRSAVKHWSVEISFLRSLPRPTEEQLQRLRALQAFIVIVDPLRKYEIDHRERPLFVNQLIQDLNDKIRSSSGSKRDEFLGAALRSLSGQPIAQPGAACNGSAANFLSLAKSRGEEPGEVLAELKQKMLIRIGRQDEVSISPLGTNLMERQLDTKRQEGTIGKAIGIESFALLERLREQLTR